LVTIVAAYSMHSIAREQVRSTANDVRALMQLAKMEAVGRNRDCRFVVESGNGLLQVWDGVDTSATGDDELLHESRLPQAVAFARPDVGPALTIDQIGATPAFQTVFAADGTVASGTGGVFFGAGGVQLSHWNGSVWESE
jgi:Tfp pilus assembly protein FimT